MDCRRRAVDATRRVAREAELASWRDQAALDEPALARSPLLWLTHHESTLTAPDAGDIARLRAQLAALREAETGPPLPPEATGATESSDAGGAEPGASGRLCAACRGRCCRLGLGGHAFLRADDLRRWLATQPGCHWDDAVEHYVGHVGAVHLADSCLFHGARGCALPRERRSEVCNAHACDTLQQVHRIEQEAPGGALVVGVLHAHALHHALLVSADGVRPLAAPVQAT